MSDIQWIDSEPDKPSYSLQAYDLIGCCLQGAAMTVGGFANGIGLLAREFFAAAEYRRAGDAQREARREIDATLRRTLRGEEPL